MLLVEAPEKKIVRRNRSRKFARRIESTRQKPVLDQPTVFLGICSTCNHAESCCFRRDTQRPVLECDEFDDHVDLPRVDRRLKPEAISSEDRSEQYKGLCINCENRTTCVFGVPGQSIWHCEEYL
jgi:hypothetical protein